MEISILTGKRLKTLQVAMSDQLLPCNCAINFDHLNLLAGDSNKFRIFLKESC